MELEKGSPLSTLVVLWAVVGLVLAFFERLLWDTLWVMLLPVLGGYALGGLGLLGASLLRARRLKWERSAIRLPVGALLSAVLVLAAWDRIDAAGDRVLFARRFARLRPVYERIAREIIADAPRDRDIWTTPEGLVVSVDRGPPVRVAFHQPGGILDNWEGAIYDPSGRLGASSAGRDFPNAFGGLLLGCEAIEGAWYRCWFT